MLNESTIRKIAITIIISGLIFLAWGHKNCEPVYVDFSVSILSIHAKNKENIYIEEEKYKNNKDINYNNIWWRKNPYRDIDELIMNVWVSKAAKGIELYIGYPRAGCDFNDWYTNLSKKKINIIINGKKYIPTGDNKYFDYKHYIAYKNIDEEQYIVDLSYKDTFRTKRIINIHWFEPPEFEKLKREKMKSANPANFSL